MAFSDEKLTNLKKAMATSGQVTNYLEVGIPTLHALLARLECAEEFAENAALAHPALKYGYDFKAWRKAAGHE